MPNSDACISQFDHTSAGVSRIEVCRAYDDSSKASSDYCICARRSAPGCRTWFQSYIQRGTRGKPRAEIAQAFNLSMRAPCFSMMSLRNYPVINHQHSAHCRIRTRLTQRLFRLVQGNAHELFVAVGCHDAGNQTTRAWRDSNPQPSDPKSEEMPREVCLSLASMRKEAQQFARICLFLGR